MRHEQRVDIGAFHASQNLFDFRLVPVIAAGIRKITFGHFGKLQMRFWGSARAGDTAGRIDDDAFGFDQTALKQRCDAENRSGRIAARIRDQTGVSNLIGEKFGQPIGRDRQRFSGSVCGV